MGCKITKEGRVFQNGVEKTQTNNMGYKMVSFNRKFVYVHRLVAIEYIPNPDNKPMVNHKDGNRSNNHVDNLEWVTASENTKHGYEVLGRKPVSNTPRKLSDEQVNEIRKKYIPRKYSMYKLANEYGVSQETINRILNNKTYKDYGLQL